MQQTLLQPMMALVVWTFIMWIWMYATRLPSVFKARVDFHKVKTGQQLRTVLPEKTNWVADNYNHLHEQPVLFYTICAVLLFTESSTDLNLKLAWIYVVLRVIHSLWQVFINDVNIRFGIFALGSLVLMTLGLNCAFLIFGLT